MPTLQAALLLSLLAMQAGPAESPAELLAHIRHHMADNLARLPNYTCRETIERTWGEAGARHLNLVDRLRLEVAYVQGGELYAWPGAASFDDRSIGDLVGGGGATSTGSFAMHARAVFTSSAPSFTWGGEERRESQRVVRFNFQVPLAKSHYAIQTGDHPVVVAYDGFFEANADTLDPIRLRVEASGLPAELKLRSAGETMEYGQSRIGDSEFLLPVSSELEMVAVNGREDSNRTRFDACKEYSGESTVRFDVDAAAAEGGAAATAIELPPGLTIESSMRDAIDESKSARGDLVHIVVTSPVKRAGAVVVPKGAVITARLSRIQTVTRRTMVYFGVGLHFQNIEFEGRRGKISADVDMAGIGSDYSVSKDPQTGDSVVFIKSKVERLALGTRLALRTK